MSLRDVQIAAGAVFEPCPGGPSQEHFGDAAAEYKAARTEAALFDLSDRTQLEITGTDRAKFLHNFCTNDIRGLQPGQGCEAFVCNVQGKVLAHVFVSATPHSILLDSVPGAAPGLLKHLEKYHISEEVSFHDRTSEWGPLFLSGPEASTILERLELPTPSAGRGSHTAATWKGTTVYLRRWDWLGFPGWEIVTSRSHLAEIWSSLRDTGARPAGSRAWQPLRLEACYPLYGADISAENLAQEVGRTNRAISFTKGCYLGQEPIARIDALGHVNRELRGLRFEEGPVPSPETDVVMAADVSRVIGRITSSAYSFGTSTPVALAYMKRSYDTPGQAVRVKVGDEAISGVVFNSASS